MRALRAAGRRHARVFPTHFLRHSDARPFVAPRIGVARHGHRGRSISRVRTLVLSEPRAPRSAFFFTLGCIARADTCPVARHHLDEHHVTLTTRTAARVSRRSERLRGSALSSRLAQAWGVSRLRRRREGSSPDRWQDAVALVKSGQATVAEAAHLIGVSRQRVHRWVYGDKWRLGRGSEFRASYLKQLWTRSK